MAEADLKPYSRELWQRQRKLEGEIRKLLEEFTSSTGFQVEVTVRLQQCYDNSVAYLVAAKPFLR